MKGKENHEKKYLLVETKSIEDLVRVAACLPSGPTLGVHPILHIEKQGEHVYAVIPFPFISNEREAMVFYKSLPRKLEQKFAKYKIEAGKEKIGFTDDLAEAEAKYFPIIEVTKIEISKKLF